MPGLFFLPVRFPLAMAGIPRRYDVTQVLCILDTPAPTCPGIVRIAAS
jgi:hypothetical protein